MMHCNTLWFSVVEQKDVIYKCADILFVFKLDNVVSSY